MPTGSPKVKRSEQARGDSERGNAAGGGAASRCGAISPGPPGSPGTRGWGLNHPPPPRRSRRRTWGGGPGRGSVRTGRCSSARVGEGRGAPARAPGPACPPRRGRLQCPMVRTRVVRGAWQRLPQAPPGGRAEEARPGEKFPCAWPSFSASRTEVGGVAPACWELTRSWSPRGWSVGWHSVPASGAATAAGCSSQGEWMARISVALNTPTPSAFGPPPSLGTVVGEKGRDSWNPCRAFSKAARGGWGIRLH